MSPEAEAIYKRLNPRRGSKKGSAKQEDSKPSQSRTSKAAEKGS